MYHIKRTGIALLVFAMQSQTILASEQTASKIEVESTELVEIREDLQYLGPSLTKNLCVSITKSEKFELTGCGIKQGTGTAPFKVTNTIRAANSQIVFESSIRDEKGVELRKITTHSGDEPYHGLTLESHCRNVLTRLQESKQAVTAPVPVQERRYSGFYFNSVAGAGWANVDGKVKGIPILLGFKVGSAISDHFVLFGSLDLYWMNRPIVNSSGVSYVTYPPSYVRLSGNLDGFVVMENFSAGVGYYSDSNYFILTSLGMGAFQVKLNSDILVLGGSNESSLSTSLTINLGKEWQVSSNWKVGLAAIGYGVMGNGKAYYFLGLAATAAYR